MTPPGKVLADLQLSDPVFVAETPIAHVWKVKQQNSCDAALKIYKDRNPKGEDVGFALMRSLDGHGMAQVLHFAGGVALLEWLDGPTLGDLSRGGQDDVANALLIKVANEIHRAPVTLPLTHLADQFSALRTLRPDPAWPEQVRENIRKAREITSGLLEKQFEIRSLHGDLHHDNIIQTPDGCRAIDPKGLIGDRAYDLANAFKNPVGARDIYLDPARAKELADRWAAQWQTTPERLLGWAVAHCALSITWAMAFDDPDETAMLAILLDHYDMTT